MNLDDTIIALQHRLDEAGSAWCVWLSRVELDCCADVASFWRTVLEANRAMFGELIEIDTGERSTTCCDLFRGSALLHHRRHCRNQLPRLACCLTQSAGDAIAKGARLAEPGEFTQRAFLKRKTGPDAGRGGARSDRRTDHIPGQSCSAQLKGSLSRVVLPMKEKLVALIARLEAGIDFAEDDVAVMPPDQILRWWKN